VLTVSGSLALLQSCAKVDRSTDACSGPLDQGAADGNKQARAVRVVLGCNRRLEMANPNAWLRSAL